MMFNEKLASFEKKLPESVGKPKDLQKILKSAGLPKNVFM